MNVQRMTDYFEGFILVAIKNKAHLEAFLPQSKLTKTECTFIIDLWDMHEGTDIEPLEAEEDISVMSKDELEDYALEEFNVDLDRRRNISTLVEQVIELKENKKD